MADKFRQPEGLSGAQLKGLAQERFVFQALIHYPFQPPWVKGVFVALQTEDQSGIDLVVDTDVGELYVQVKSSQHFVAKFHRQERRRGRGRPIVVVNGQRFDTLMDTGQFLYMKLTDLRRQIQRDGYPQAVIEDMAKRRRHALRTPKKESQKRKNGKASQSARKKATPPKKHPMERRFERKK